ncbi:TadG family pilus assembly protein [Rhizobium sp. LjRoot30]
MRLKNASLRKWQHDRSGNIALSSALIAPLVIMILGLGVDFGALTLQKRQAQGLADIAAIVAASQLDQAETNLAEHFRTNGINLVVQSSRGLIKPDGEILPAGEAIYPHFGGIATVERGRYAADPNLPVDQRFEPGTAPFDSARVNIEEPGEVYFAGIFSTSPVVTASGVAATQKYAAFTIGSRLASINDGLLNDLLGGLLGAKLTLSLMDYKALANIDINALSFVDALAVHVGLQALSYEDILQQDISYGQFLAALGKTTGVTPSVAAILKGVEQAIGKSSARLKLSQILDLHAIGSNPVGSHQNLMVKANLLQLVNAGAVAAGGGKQVGINLAGKIPGLASISLTVAIGEPPVETPSIKVGDPGSIVRTAQTRLLVDASIDGLALLAGLKLHLPIYVEIAHAEARLADIRCLGGVGTNANVTIDTVPGVLELAIGAVDTSAFANFSDKPRVTPARILSSAALKVTAMAHVNTTNMKPTRLTFTPADIAANKIRNVSTKDALTSTVSSLLGNLTLEIDLLGLPLGTPKAVQTALANTLAGVTAPLDDLLYNTLLILGVKIGEADVSVSDVRCRNAVLVQ